MAFTPAPHFTFFAGKGGVGKTTCAAASAVAAARSGDRVLVVSTDPAHSLADALAVKLGARPTRIAPRLAGLELDASRAFGTWLRQHRQALGDILEHGTWMDRDDVEALLTLAIPGVDEVAGVLEIARLASAGRARFDRVVVDTAPTGHTLRLLTAPATLGAVAGVLDDLQRDHRLIREQLARVVRPEAADRLIALVAEQAREVGDLLRDSARTAFHWIMLPQELSLAETADGLKALEAAHIAVTRVIVNRVLPPGPACSLCDGRRRDEKRLIARARRGVLGRRDVIVVPEGTSEPRGVRALASLARHLAGDCLAPVPSSRGAGPVPRAQGRCRNGAGVPRAALTAIGGASLVVFAGKGGVGKTTSAAAAALVLARTPPFPAVLLLSTDPAHSLGDVFDAEVSDVPAPLPDGPPNLHVREIDAPAEFRRRRASVEGALSELGVSVGSAGVSAARGIRELLDLAPPGIDELLGLVSVAEAVSGQKDDEPGPGGERGAPRYDRIVIDAAPTGHTLRLFELPDVAREWLQVLMRVLLKYREVVAPGQLGAELLNLSRSVRRLQDLLRDPRRARFAIVTRAAEVPRLETERLLGRLHRWRIAAPVVIVNAMTLAPGRCSQCRRTAAAEGRQLAALARRCARRSAACVIIRTPLVSPPPRGAGALDAWARLWIA